MVASQNLLRQTLILRLEGGALERSRPGSEFDLWVDKRGTRVFGAHEFTGTRMVWLALEDRVLVTDELWGLLGVGVAPFLDYGGGGVGGGTGRPGGGRGGGPPRGPPPSGAGGGARSFFGDRARHSLVRST